VITNIDLEHVDHYGSLEAIIEAFRQFADKVPFYGVTILCADDPLAARLASDLKRRVISYGTSADSDLMITDIQPDGFSSRFWLSDLGEFTVRMPGRHNVLNATAAIAVGRELGINAAKIRSALASFDGVGRRFDVARTAAGITLVDDYGHHPTEVRAVLDTVREIWDGRIHCIFQPHRYSRTQALWRAFGPAFSSVDQVWLLPVYAAGENEIPGVDSRMIFRAVREAGHEGVSLLDCDTESVAEQIRPFLQSGDVVVTLGAGDVWKVHRVLERELGDG